MVFPFFRHLDYKTLNLMECDSTSDNVHTAHSDPLILMVQYHIEIYQLKWIADHMKELIDRLAPYLSNQNLEQDDIIVEKLSETHPRFSRTCDKLGRMCDALSDLENLI